jgi:methionine-rich copper-binding protein CopC
MFTRRLATVLLAGTALLATAAPALAHTELQSSDPAKGAALPFGPQQVTLTFSEAVRFEGIDIKVTGPGGAQWIVQRAVVKGPVVTAAVVPSGPAGAYTLTWRVFADDGDPVAGKIAFTMTGPAVPPPPPPPITTVPTTSTTSTTPPTTQPATATSQPGVDPAAQQQQNDGGNGVPVWIWIVIAVIVIAGVVVGVIRSRRRDASAE